MSARSDELEGLREGEPSAGPGQASADLDGPGEAAETEAAETTVAEPPLRKRSPAAEAEAAVADLPLRKRSVAAEPDREPKSEREPDREAAAPADEPPVRKRSAVLAEQPDASAPAGEPPVTDEREAISGPDPAEATVSVPLDGRQRPHAVPQPQRGSEEPAPADLDETTVVQTPKDGPVEPAPADLDKTTVVQISPDASAKPAPADLDKTTVVQAPLDVPGKPAAVDPDATAVIEVPRDLRPAPQPQHAADEAPADLGATTVLQAPLDGRRRPHSQPRSGESAAAAAEATAGLAETRVHRHISTDAVTTPVDSSVGQDVADETARAMAEAGADEAVATESDADESPVRETAAAGTPPRRPARHTPLYGRGIRILPWKHKSRLAAPQRRRRKIVVRSIWGCVLIFVATIGWSVGGALTAPGTDTIQVRLAEWGRDHGLAGVVSTLERWQYDLNPPKKGGSLDASQLTDLGPTSEPQQPKPSATAGKPAADFIPMRPNLPAPAGLTLDPGEGVFHVAVSTPDDQPVIQFAKIRPDAVYTSVLEDVVWIDQKRTSYVLHPGHEGGVNKKVPVPNQIDADARPDLVALYNGGFKISESHGGYYDHGITVAPLVDGAASEVIFKDGHLSVGMWGRDLSFAKDPDIVSVRQNLRLMVDGGQVVPYINDASNWGRSDHGSAAVWRSGVGVTPQGDVVYVAGNDLTAPSLANLLKLAGAQYAMQLDINLRWADFQYFPNRDGNPDTSKMYKDFLQGPTKFFYDSTKDFMAIYLRPENS